MYWTIRQFPELQHLDAEHRAVLLRRVPWWTYPLAIGRAAILGWGAGLIVWQMFALIVSFSGRPDFEGFTPWAGAAVGGLLAVGIYVLQMHRIRVVIRRVVASTYVGERLPFCFHCGYDLRESHGAGCPECGRDV